MHRHVPFLQGASKQENQGQHEARQGGWNEARRSDDGCSADLFFVRWYLMVVTTSNSMSVPGAPQSSTFTGIPEFNMGKTVLFVGTGMKTPTTNVNDHPPSITMARNNEPTNTTAHHPAGRCGSSLAFSSTSSIELEESHCPNLYQNRVANAPSGIHPQHSCGFDGQEDALLLLSCDCLPLLLAGPRSISCLLVFCG